MRIHIADESDFLSSWMSGNTERSALMILSPYWTNTSLDPCKIKKDD